MEEKNKIYIKIHEKYCQQRESKIETRPVFNIMTLPPGTIVGETDLSYGMINPRVMFRDQFNPNMFCAVYDKSLLNNQSIQVYFPREDKRMPINIDELAFSVDRANKEYLKSRQEERAEDVAESSNVQRKVEVEVETTSKTSETKKKELTVEELSKEADYEV